jgi:hypothetical protein
MADKKITSLDTRAQVLTTDLVPIVGNTAGTPDNYSSPAGDFLVDVLFLGDLTAPSTNVSAPNSSVTLTKANTAQAANVATLATHQLKITLGGVNYWLLASNVAPA